MNTHGSVSDTLRIQVEVSGETYRSLVVGLRSQHASPISARPTTRRVKALVDFTISEGRFSIRSLGNHRLPRPLGIKQGSATHDSLAQLLARVPEANSNDVLRQALQAIIAAVPGIHLDTLRVNPRDLELLPRDSATADITPAALPIIASIAPTILFDIDDAPTLVISEAPDAKDLDSLTLLKESIRFADLPVATAVDNFVEVIATVETPAAPGAAIDFFVHWGSYEDLAPAWQDELLASSVALSEPRTTKLYFRTHIPDRGWHGATFFAQPHDSSERIWVGRPNQDDARFNIIADDFARTELRRAQYEAARADAHARLSVAISDPNEALKAIRELSKSTPYVAASEILAETLSKSGNESEILQNLTTNCSDVQLAEIARTIASTYGVGEIVFATPEGPQAAAGGLAQVISGLPPELCKAGIPVSIITPLYRYENGNKHRSAESLLDQGILINSVTVKPSYIGSITVHLGPTHHSGSLHTHRAPSAVPIKVYLAQHENLRVFLLLNNAAFDRVYQAVYADEQLRRSIILCRAVLETIATPHFGLRPAAIISNDWMTACVPAFLALDPRYQESPLLAHCKTIHMIHNGGADYHGRLPCNVNNEDLWPMLNLSPEHFFGFCDPHRSELLNLTMAAAKHVTGGVLTVSRPYAEQICSPGGGDGLEQILQHKRSSVYGISNGINRTHVDSFLSVLTGLSTDELRSAQSLLDAKSRIRTRLQERLGLTIDKGAALLSFVGRLAEQKGLHLLSGYVEGAARSTIEDLLERNPEMQIIVAGPLTNGDSSAGALRATIEYLRCKYPGRVAAEFDYISHSRALEIIFGSTMFLMPSRFEPGGITQLEALAAGTLVIGRNVGGISATIQNFEPSTGAGNGFLCNEYSPTAFANTAHWALDVVRDRRQHEKLISQAVTAPHSWSDRAPACIAVLQEILLGRERLAQLQATEANRLLAASASPLA
jgi:starch synthase